jgi:hypothetical protein
VGLTYTAVTAVGGLGAAVHVEVEDVVEFLDRKTIIMIKIAMTIVTKTTVRPIVAFVLLG